MAIFNKKGTPRELAELTWRRGDEFFTPILRGSAGMLAVASFPDEWQLALSEICAVGWRLHSWQVVNDASAGSFVAAPLFVRPVNAE